jgi:hypothetical protein
MLSITPGQLLTARLAAIFRCGCGWISNSTESQQQHLLIGCFSAKQRSPLKLALCRAERDTTDCSGRRLIS